MPRKEYVPKNKFCKRSKLDDDEFAAIVRFYFHELLYGDSRNNYCFYFERWHFINKKLKRKIIDPPNVNMHLYDDTLFPSSYNVEGKAFKEWKTKTRNDGKNELLTRQKISNYFNKISQYLWENHIGCLNPSFHEEDFFDYLLDMIYEKELKTSYPYKEIYDGLCHSILCSRDGEITSSLMFYWLFNRSKVVRGYKKDKFYLEFSRAFFVCIIIMLNKINFSSIYSTKQDLKLYEILTASTAMLLVMLERKTL